MSAIQDRPFIPLSSDTETRPTAAMRAAIANAEVGDEQRGEDPTVNRLQDRVAELLGKEAALWFPGGTFWTLDELGAVCTDARADGLAGVKGIDVITTHPATNMVYFDSAATGLSPESFLARLLSRGVRMGQGRGY